MIKRNKETIHPERGFTIVELMIALSILSIILVTSSIVLIRIGGMYNKGVNSASLQNTNRTIITDISKGLQFSGSAPDGCFNKIGTDVKPTCYHAVANSTAAGDTYPIYTYCVGTTRYSYVLDRAAGTDLYPTEKKTPHVLWRDTLLNPGTCPWLDISVQNVSNANAISGSGFDMVPAKMRIGKFEVVPVGPVENRTYNINVLMAYGDSDLMVPSPNSAGEPYSCKGGTASQYCAISHMTNLVARRVK